MTQKQIQTTLLDRLESIGLERFYFLQKQKVAKTLAKIRTSCGFYFLDTSLHCVLLSMTEGGAISLTMTSGSADSLYMINSLDYTTCLKASRVMTKITTSSLRGSLSNSENNEAIHKNKIDCHDSAKPNLAMTAWDRLPRKSYEFAEFAKLIMTEKIAWRR